MRKLTLEDAFTLSEVLDKMNIQTDLNKVIDEAKSKGEEAQSYLGGQLVIIILKSAYKAKAELYAWIASIAEKSVDDIKQMGLKDLASLMKEVLTQEGIGDFFKSAVVE